MSYRNSMKLFASNFSYVWKQVVYLLICLVLLGICSYTTINPIVAVFRDNNFGAEFDNLSKILAESPNEIALNIRNIFKSFIVVVANNFSKLYISLFFAALLCVVMPYVFIQISLYNLSSIAYQKTTMNMTIKYSQNALSTFKPGLKYALVSLVGSLPFLLIDCSLVLIYITFAKSMLSAIVGLVILSAFTMFFESIKIAIFANFTGLAVSNPNGMFKSYIKSCGIVFKNFLKNISSSLILYLTITVVNGFVLVFTFFAGLLVSIPASFVLMAFYYIVSYLNASGQRYYLSDTIIYNPVRHVVKKDDFVTISIPEVETEVQVENIKIKKNYKNKKSKN